MKSIMFRTLFLLAFLLFNGVVQGQKLVTTKVTDKIKVKIPKTFNPMSEQDKAQRYESARLPIALFTSPDRLADFGVNRAYSVWRESDLEMLEEFYEATIMELYDKVEFLDKGIKEVNGHRFVYFEFTSNVYPENQFQGNIAKYTYLMYGLNEGTTYIFNFTSEKSAQNQWQSVAREVMASIKLK
jgi:hypothetical protein